MKNQGVVNAPLLTKLSTYKSTPKWTLSSACTNSCLDIPASEALGPAAYNPNNCIDRISKFRRIASACSFGTSKRFSLSESKVSLDHAPPGPGRYSPPADFSRAPYRSVSNITFGTGGRLFPERLYGSRRAGPAPNEYDIRGKHRFGGSSLDTKGVHVNTRHGWFYDSEVKARRNNPSPGSYEPKYPRDATNVQFSFGNAARIPLEPRKVSPPPGTYDAKSTLGGRAYSFTHARTKRPSPDHTVGPLCNQPTQFG
jgi:hypothetical protein